MRIDGVLAKVASVMPISQDIQEFFTDSIPEEDIQLFREQGYCKIRNTL